jgi:hypothetical protein
MVLGYPSTDFSFLFLSLETVGNFGKRWKALENLESVGKFGKRWKIWKPFQEKEKHSWVATGEVAF